MDTVVHLEGSKPDAQDRDRFPLSAPARGLLAVLSVAAAIIHLVMVPAHAADSLVLGLSFALSGWFQLGFGVMVIAVPGRNVLRVGVIANVVFLGVWALSRTKGLPFGLEGGVPEPATLIDLTCGGIEAVLVVACGYFLRRPTAGERWGSGALVIASLVPLSVVALATTAVASPSARTHDHGHDVSVAAGAEGGGQDHAMDHAADPNMDHAGMDHAGMDHAGANPSGDHTHPAAGAPSGEHDHAPASPVSTLPWAIGATDTDIADTQAFITKTQAAVATFTSVADAEAKGYVRINADHLLSPQLLLDNKIMDPTAIESLIVGQRDGQDFIAGGMYLMNLGQTMKDVPRLGGPLLMWHTHGGFCFDQNVKIVGADPATGSCPSDAHWFDDPPMTHIWSNPQPNADGKLRTPDACGVFVYLDLPHDRLVPGCSADLGTGHTHA